MQRGELLVTIVLTALIVAGIAYDSLRGADKTAEVIVAHPARTPFDVNPASPVSPPSVSPATGSSPAPSVSGNPTLLENRLIDFLNRGSAAEIESLPGIGSVLAQRILQKRQQLGRFGNLDDLLGVSGIGKAKLNGLIEGMNPVAVPPTPIIHTLPHHPTPRIPPSIPSPAKPFPAKRSLNQATRGELMEVSGIGERLADTILQAREKKGGFHSWNDVASVSGIGEKRLERIKERFTLPKDKP